MLRLFLFSLLLHFVADFTLQGCLADMKQWRWWNELFNQKIFSLRVVHSQKYRYDWICGLLCHSMYWALLTFAPLIWLADSDWTVAWMVVANCAFHAVVDDMKCNRFKINLCQDQILHLAQIALTYVYS